MIKGKLSSKIIDWKCYESIKGGGGGGKPAKASWKVAPEMVLDK